MYSVFSIFFPVESKSYKIRCLSFVSNSRSHKHPGCRRAHQILSSSATSNKDMKTDYQARFGDFHIVAPRKPLGPRRTDINLFTTHMNLKTENQAAYKNFGKVDRPRQCKVSFVY